MSDMHDVIADEKISADERKMLGAHVPEELYWQFKNAAASRKEQLKDAIAHAAMMYIDAHKEKQ